MQCKGTNSKGKRCGNKAIDATGYCRHHHSQTSHRPSTGGEFEKKVLKVLRLLGYKVERNVNIHGCQIDVYGEYRTGVIALKLMVECKDYGKGKTVGIEEINKFAGVLAVARNTGVVDKGLFVTTQGYTAMAKQNARQAGIELTTYRELSTQLVDFENYIEQIIAEFEQSPVSKYYVDLSAIESEDYEGADESMFHRPLDYVVNQRLLSEDSYNQLALLGNFGTGKSTFCRKYARDLAKSYQKDPTQRIPIVISLSNYDSKLHIQQVVLNTLQFQYNVNITLSLCQELQRLGKFVLLFDGFDEMAIKVDSVTIRENLREIEKISDIAQNKFIITCRTHYFRDKIDADVLGNFALLYIPEWDERELKEYLQKRFGSKWEKQLERISGTHNLPELARTPIFLEMIVETLSKLGDEVKRVELYEAYTKKWIENQSRRRGARLTIHERENLVRELAMKLYLENKSVCHYKEFIPFLKKQFEIDDAAQMDYLSSDVQTCTFLTRDSKGNYGFRHKSFMEFFVAKTLANNIRNNSHEYLETKLPVEIRGFLIDFLINNPPAKTLKDWLEKTENQIIKENCLLIISLLKIDISDKTIDIEGVNDRETKTISLFIQGNVKAFDILYRYYRSDHHLNAYISAIISRYNLSNEIDKDDLLTEVFTSIWERRDEIDIVNNTQFRSYIKHQILKHCLKQTRRNVRDVNMLSFANLELDRININQEHFIDSLVDRDKIIEQKDMLMNAINRLPEINQKIIIMSYLEDKNTSEIARELKLKQAVVRVIRHRAIKQLRQYLIDESKDLVQ